MASVELEFRHFTAEEARGIRDTVQLIYEESYADAIASGDPFDSVEAFMVRFDSYTSPQNAGFELVVGYANGDPVGQTWGWPLGPSSAWWGGLLSEPDPDFAQEDGTRTFALSEIMVRRKWAGRGLAHALHDELLSHRHERRATLLVEPENDRAYRAYLKWGWSKVARLRPGWPDAPLFDVLIRPLG